MYRHDMLVRESFRDGKLLAYRVEDDRDVEWHINFGYLRTFKTKKAMLQALREIKERGHV